MSTSNQLGWIIREVLYDNLGRAALTTVLVKKGGADQNYVNSLGFVKDFVVERNPADGGELWRGGPFDKKSLITQWVDYASFTEQDDPEYAYQGSYFESTPSSRVVQQSSPGVSFKRDSSHVVNSNYGQLITDAQSDFQGLGITQADLTTRYQANYKQTSLGKIGTVTSSSLTNFNDELVASLVTDQDNSKWLVGHAQSISAGLTNAVNGNASSTTGLMYQRKTLLPNYFVSNIKNANQFYRLHQYDILNNLVTDYTNDTGQTNYYTDPYGRLRFSQNADQANKNTNGVIIYYLYDELNRLTEIGYFASSWDVSSLQQMGLQAAPQPPSGAVKLRQIDYDMLPDSQLTNTSSQGQIVQIKNSTSLANQSKGTVSILSGSELQQLYTYDQLGRLNTIEIKRGDAENYTTQYAYDGLSNVAAVTYPSSFIVTYTYNAQNFVAAVGYTDTSTNTANPEYYGIYTYNPNSSIATESLANTAKTTIVRSYVYGNSLQQLTSISDNQSYFTEKLTYTSDNNYYQDGNIQTASYQYANSINAILPNYQVNYTYNALSHLMKAKYYNAEGTIAEETISHDSNGNITELTKLLSSAGATRNYAYTYLDGKNQLSQLSSVEGDVNYIYTNTGLPYEINDSIYAYDQLTNLPSQAALGDAQNNENVSIIYDAQGRRFQKQTPAGKKIYTYGNGLNVLEEYQHADEVSLRYIYGPMGLICVNAPQAAQDYFVLKDHLNSTRVVYNPQNDEIAAYYIYNSYGGIIESGGSQASLINYLYTGQEWDTDLNLYNYRARLYDPDLGRFLMPDQARQFSSPYVYVGDNPINAIDPTGMISLSTARLILGSLRTLVYTAITTVVGAAVGAIFKHDHARGAKIGALYGLAVGAGIGLLSIAYDMVLVPLVRRYRARGNLKFPIVLYSTYNEVELFGGRLMVSTAEVSGQVVAEANHIPRYLWDEHIIAYNPNTMGENIQKVIGSGKFDGNIILITHGHESGVAELSNHLTLKYLNGGEAFKYIFDGLSSEQRSKITAFDFEICLAASTPAASTKVNEANKDNLSFLDSFANAAKANNQKLTITASSGFVFPAGFGFSMGIGNANAADTNISLLSAKEAAHQFTLGLLPLGQTFEKSQTLDSELSLWKRIQT